MYQRITVLHFNDSLQVILAARFIWRWHSNNTTTLRFQWKTCDLFIVQNDFAHLCHFVTKFGYAVWSAWKYYSMCGISYCLKDKNIIKVPWLILFLYSKTSVQNNFVQCPIVFVCDLWSDLWPVTCGLTCDLACGLWPVTWPVTCDLHFSPAGLQPLDTFKMDAKVNEPGWACAKEQARWPGVPSLYCFQAPFF